MGSVSRHNRCERFIAEFGNEAAGLGMYVDLPSFRCQNFGVRDSDECVYLFVGLEWQGADFELMEDTIYFDPEEPDEDMMARVAELLHLEEDEAERRLKVAGLM